MKFFFSSGRKCLRSLLEIYFPVNSHFGDRPEKNRMINGRINKTHSVVRTKDSLNLTAKTSQNIYLSYYNNVKLFASNFHIKAPTLSTFSR